MQGKPTSSCSAKCVATHDVVDPENRGGVLFAAGVTAAIRPAKTMRAPTRAWQ